MSYLYFSCLVIDPSQAVEVIAADALSHLQSISGGWEKADDSDESDGDDGDGGGGDDGVGDDKDDDDDDELHAVKT